MSATRRFATIRDPVTRAAFSKRRSLAWDLGTRDLGIGFERRPRSVARLCKQYRCSCPIGHRSL